MIELVSLNEFISSLEVHIDGALTRNILLKYANTHISIIKFLSCGSIASVLLIRLLLCKLPDDRVFDKGLLISDYLVARENEVV